MSEFNAINIFGSLTINGKKLTFEDFDKNSDGKISTQEYNSLLSELKLDSVDLSNVDNNEDKAISKEEFSLWEQKILMLDAVNDLSVKISSDFSGKSQYLEELTKQLKTLINDYAQTFYGDVSIMAEEFKKELPEKYEQIKQGLLAEDPTTISAEVVFEYSQELANRYAQQDIPENFITRIVSELNKEASKFIQNYSGDDLQYDLRARLENFLNTSDSESMIDSFALFQEKMFGYGAEGLSIIKEQAKILFQTAIEKGITLNIAGKNILTESAITNVLMMFDSAEDLLNEINKAISELTTEPKIDVILKEEQEKAILAAEKRFTDVKGSDYVIKVDQIDWTQVDERYSQEGGEIYQRGKGWSGSKEKAYNEGFEILTSDGLKNQIKSQIEKMLEAKNVSFDRIEQVFENVYNQTAQNTLNAEGMITGRGARGLSSKGKAYINVKTLCDNFVANFNINITKAIVDMNKSNTDFDTIDLDYGAMNKDENGVSAAQNGEDFAALYASGQTVTVKKKGADYYVKIAEKLLDNMKRQMLEKAQAMCKANGVEFDESVFNTMFDSAKLSALKAGVSGVDSKGGKLNVGSTAVGAALGGAVVAATATEVISGVALSAWTCSSVWAGLGTLTIPVAGWVVGGALLLGGIIAGILGSQRSSQSSLNTKILMDTFTEEFKKNFTAWVEQEKTEAKSA